MHFNQFSQQQQQPNQATASQPTILPPSRRNRRRNEDEPIPTPTSKKTSRCPRMKSKSKKTKEKEAQVEAKKRARILWSQEEELILAESFIQVSEDPRVRSDKKMILFGTKFLKHTMLMPRNAATWSVHVDGKVDGRRLSTRG
nr:hypothetical protein [Tanacetum cinerariifolium]